VNENPVRPRCGAPGRSLGERPVGGRTVHHCRRYGKLWPSAEVKPTAPHPSSSVKSSGANASGRT
jgi:hypothetical protein